jgi:hypothetical protein
MVKMEFVRLEAKCLRWKLVPLYNNIVKLFGGYVIDPVGNLQEQALHRRIFMWSPAGDRRPTSPTANVTSYPALLMVSATWRANLEQDLYVQGWIRRNFVILRFNPCYRHTGYKCMQVYTCSRIFRSASSWSQLCKDPWRYLTQKPLKLHYRIVIWLRTPLKYPGIS